MKTSFVQKARMIIVQTRLQLLCQFEEGNDFNLTSSLPSLPQLCHHPSYPLRYCFGACKRNPQLQGRTAKIWKNICWKQIIIIGINFRFELSLRSYPVVWQQISYSYLITLASMRWRHMFQNVGAPENSLPEQFVSYFSVPWTCFSYIFLFFHFRQYLREIGNLIQQGRFPFKFDFMNDFFLHLSRSQACPNCDTKFPTCIVTGRPLMDYQFWMCGTCKHRAYEQEINKINHCPLCHAPVWSPITTLCIDIIPSSLTARRIEQGLIWSVLLTVSLKLKDSLILKYVIFPYYAISYNQA